MIKWLFKCFKTIKLKNLKLTVLRFWPGPASHLYYFYLLKNIKVNNRNTRARWEICLKLTIKTPERDQLHRSGVFIKNFEHISHLVLVFLSITLNMELLVRLTLYVYKMKMPNKKLLFLLWLLLLSLIAALSVTFLPCQIEMLIFRRKQFSLSNEHLISFKNDFWFLFWICIQNERHLNK